ncbi:Gfo/Idh/MocA family protein [Fimbriimonas ginsengisoli]|uniref:NADH-dependent dehydrogenase n=1 Tax=Fimbriimonas ginsengisoli Gsoil 348 TaxID=661478 RepID=A0A068NRT4_FIMGI|nr:Gfo/Idh/MocA family oxidoreductase [Fimbriimonas ginsengisoli]AIE86263.1 NADH-dependent dehydrogenase [Fimbriimonas ginsengisoli Gsoil 348]
MPLRIGILTCAHMHCWSYVSCLRGHPDAQIVGIWDDEVERGETFAQQAGITYTGYFDDLLAACDAVCITTENKRHAELGILAAKAGKHILCEKPLVTSEEEGARLLAAVKEAGVVLMTAFPCRFVPAYMELREKVRAGEIGKIRAICATNRGQCPGGWFIEREKSGGGAMIDHVVHVADLLRDLLQEEPVRVQAQTGSNVYHQDWEDTAMLTIEFPSGIFATLDSSWSRPKTYRTWGDVTMNVVGDEGTIEVDLFGSDAQLYTLSSSPAHQSQGWGSDADRAMVEEFVQACLARREAAVTGFDGFQAARVALAGYRSADLGQAVAL